MLTALNVTGRVEASRSLVRTQRFTCPVCNSAVTLKPGRVIVPHFAHRPGSDCSAGQGETREHLQAKATMLAGLRASGYVVSAEIDHRDRRVDVRVETKRGPVAIELQHSPIDLATIKQRNRADRAHGYFDTLWVFLPSRVPGEGERRVPAEIRDLCKSRPVWVLTGERLFQLRLETIVRPGGEYYLPDGDGDTAWAPDRALVSTKRVSFLPRHFGLKVSQRQSGKRSFVTFVSTPVVK